MDHRFTTMHLLQLFTTAQAWPHDEVFGDLLGLLAGDKRLNPTLFIWGVLPEYMLVGLIFRLLEYPKKSAMKYDIIHIDIGRDVVVQETLQTRNLLCSEFLIGVGPKPLSD
jgi:hypothetical protein